ncbi:MAG: 50S ribosomal protein L18 [Planctomycetota bacterium]|nr:50S ribosomal protein L18 [Planctomycetota bacterium]MEC7680706.1 50S ribosomal protein L18 [Planctomycetota bacterium]
MDKNKQIQKRRQRRRFQVRSKVRGSASQPRLCVFRSLKHFSCQLVDDDAGKTLASASTRDKALKDQFTTTGNCDAAALVGKAIAEKASASGIQTVKFDRGHNRFHGRVKSFAEAAREGGLQF